MSGITLDAIHFEAARLEFERFISGFYCVYGVFEAA